MKGIEGQRFYPSTVCHRMSMCLIGIGAVILLIWFFVHDSMPIFLNIGLLFVGIYFTLEGIMRMIAVSQQSTWVEIRKDELLVRTYWGREISLPWNVIEAISDQTFLGITNFRVHRNDNRMNPIVSLIGYTDPVLIHEIAGRGKIALSEGVIEHIRDLVKGYDEYRAEVEKRNEEEKSDGFVRKAMPWIIFVLTFVLSIFAYDHSIPLASGIMGVGVGCATFVKMKEVRLSWRIVIAILFPVGLLTGLWIGGRLFAILLSLPAGVLYFFAPEEER